MKPRRTRKQLTIQNSMAAIIASIFLIVMLVMLIWSMRSSNVNGAYRYTSTIAGTTDEFGEPFGIAVNGRDIYVSDGQHGKIWRISGGKTTVFADGLETPSGIAFDKNGNLIVADSGSHTIKSVNSKGEITVITGTENLKAPIGVTVSDNKIYIADTYNDRICLIENGKTTTLAGSVRGYADGLGPDAKFDTPAGLAMWQDKLLVADTGNHRIRVVEQDGRVWTLAGNGEADLKNGLLSASSFVQPTAVAVDKNGPIFVADGNAIRQIGGRILPSVSTISDEQRGIKDGTAPRSRFNRPSGLAIDADGNLLVADSENRLVRRFAPNKSGHAITRDEIAALRDKSDEFRSLQLGRWPYDPPTAKRDIAGTLGEIRGELTGGNDQVWFHNGLDIAGAYGETARFIRDEKVLRPVAAENFGTLREFIRLPMLGYIHIRLGRNEASFPFDDSRFLFDKDGAGKLTNVRVPRGTKFKAGEPIGTLNSMNHVHLIAGRSGSEMNALDALTLPGLTDSRPPTIEKVTLFDENWREIETAAKDSRIKLTGKTRIVVRAYDQADGNSERRRLGVYKLGYQILKQDGSVEQETKWTISFNRLPAAAAVSLAYANGSKSGATGETIFSYVATNFVDGDDFREGFLDTATLTNGIYVLRVFAADYFGNTSSGDVEFEVIK